MKTENRTHPASWMTAVIGLALIALASSCNSQGSSQKKESGVKTPDVDIHTAVLTGNQEALKQHIAAGTNINEKDPFGGSSPLISAAVFGKTEEAKILIDAGADINFQNNDGSTPLHTAAFFCRPEIVRMLLDKGADKTIKNKYGATPALTVAGSFADSKNVYDMMGKALEPMGLKLDYAYIEKTRPEIAEMLK
ncbi:ankyrin repeat domain-containing protein [Chryseolinea soli]|uniref:Ankyrin repeat domain-containing protein n=1 Tax=Chryseolinea soli TaxID=2321403 RepID=A0A385SJ74_9BACT|nr:ankyrin repeat domain-containing protein [Chryseolinea soli]AYB29058.1 ankyrin repeat domain-containing protein [Chryseolinea soli]